METILHKFHFQFHLHSQLLCQHPVSHCLFVFCHPLQQNMMTGHLMVIEEVTVARVVGSFEQLLLPIPTGLLTNSPSTTRRWSDLVSSIITLRTLRHIQNPLSLIMRIEFLYVLSILLMMIFNVRSVNHLGFLRVNRKNCILKKL